uniref:Uncharacterized protein n=1 Tax=Meloidogyne incognita TaxID=6306 RepID=A0A914LWV9_MELIC
MIDEFDTSKSEDKKTEGEEKNKNELNLFSIIPQNDIKKKENEKEDDFLGRIARYLRHNPWAIGIILTIGACAIGGRIYLMHTTSQLIVNDLRTNVFRNILQQDMAFFDKNKVGEIVSRLSSDAYIVGNALSTNLGDGIRSLSTSFVTAGMMGYTSPELSLLGLIVIPFIAGTFLVYGKWIGYYATQMQEAIAGTNELATERLSNVKTVRVFVAENKELKAYRNKISDIWEISRKEGRATAFIVGGLTEGGGFDSLHGQLIVNDLRTNVFRNILQQDMAFFDKNKVGEIVSRLSSDAYIVGNALSTNLGDGIRSLSTSFVTAGMMGYTSPELSLLGLIVIPFIAGTFLVYGKWIGYYATQMQEAIAGTNELATERLSNVKTVRVFVAENKELKAYRNKISDIWEISRKEGRATAFIVGGYYIVGYGFLSSLLYYGSHLISCGLLTYGDLSSFVIYAILCSANISNIRTFYSELMRGLGASSRLFELRDTKPKIPLSGGVCLTDLKEGIRFESVAFSYPDRDPIFNDITFKIPVGSTTAIVGSSGCGKINNCTFIVKTFGSIKAKEFFNFRLYSPTQGRILIDGQDMKNIDPSEWRKMCGVVSQEPVLFSATIKENILYGVPEGKEIGDEEIEKAAKLSNSLEFIRSFPQGFDTMVGEHGSSMLSGGIELEIFIDCIRNRYVTGRKTVRDSGQRQRIALARALIMKPRFIILDEATSALDATSEYLVRKSLEVLSKSGQTILIIAHRLSTIKHAEQIVVLDKGSVAEMGCFDDLMNIKDGIFQKLVEKQTLDWKFDRF